MVKLWIFREEVFHELKKKDTLLRVEERFWKSQKGIIAGSVESQLEEAGGGREVLRVVHYEVML